MFLILQVSCFLFRQSISCQSMMLLTICLPSVIAMEGRWYDEDTGLYYQSAGYNYQLLHKELVEGKICINYLNE